MSPVWAKKEDIVVFFLSLASCFPTATVTATVLLFHLHAVNDSWLYKGCRHQLRANLFPDTHMQLASLPPTLAFNCTWYLSAGADHITSGSSSSCAGGIFHYTLLISLAALQIVLNVSCSGHQHSVSIISFELATVNQELTASWQIGLGRRASSQVGERRQTALTSR